MADEPHAGAAIGSQLEPLDGGATGQLGSSGARHATDASPGIPSVSRTGARNVARVTEQSEWLPKPRWRTRASRPSLWAAVAVTFAAIVAVGWAVLLLVMLLIDYADLPGWLIHAAWIVPTLGTLVWALLRPSPATASEDEAQPWSDYAVRAVMIGVDEPRPMAARVVTGIVFGAPLVVYLTITVVLEAIGVF